MKGKTFGDVTITRIQPERLRATPPKDVVEFCQQLGLPLYVIKDRKLYSGKLSEDGEKLVPANDEEIKPGQLQKAEINPEKRTQIIEEILETAPFSIGSEDIERINARNGGRSAYFQYIGRDKLADLPGEEIEYDPKIHPDLSWLEVKPGQVLRVLKKVQNIGSENTFWEVDSKLLLLHDRGPEEFGRSSRVSVENYSRLAKREGKFIWVGRSNFETSYPIRTAKDFVRALAEKIEKIKSDIAKDEERIKSAKSQEDVQGAQRSKAFWQNWLIEIGFYVNGSADQAEELGDKETCSTLRAIAANAVDQESYQETVKKRVSEKTPFKLTIDDLRAIRIDI